MVPFKDRYELASDNTAWICPEAWAALEEANHDEAPSYGDDKWTKRVCELVCEIFEKECEVFCVFNGTAANALSLAQLCQSFHSVICHKHAHIESDECGAPEFFTKGSKLVLVDGAEGKIDIVRAEQAITRHRDLHSPKPRTLSITQSTEFGTVYTLPELGAITDLAKRRNLFVHMDGARFANAVASLNCSPKELTWQIGVDVLCFGGTKNGTAAGELVIFFNKELAREFDYRAKQAGQLASKMRFLTAPWVGLLSNDVWLKNARHANAMAKLLAQQLRDIASVEILYPVEASAVFMRMNEKLVKDLHARGWHFYKFIEPDIYRVMTSWAVSEENISDFGSDTRSLTK